VTFIAGNMADKAWVYTCGTWDVGDGQVAEVARCHLPSYQTPSNSFYIMRYLYFYIPETMFLKVTPELQTRFSR
jgi:hypothetical protein